MGNSLSIIKPSLSDQTDFFIKNLSWLIDQDIYWFCERIEALRAKDFAHVRFIESTYLNPLQGKIKELAKRMGDV